MLVPYHHDEDHITATLCVRIPSSTEELWYDVTELQTAFHPEPPWVASARAMIALRVQ